MSGAVAGDRSTTGGATPRFRRARRADVAAVVAVLADDELGSARERVAEPLPEG